MLFSSLQTPFLVGGVAPKWLKIRWGHGGQAGPGWMGAFLGRRGEVGRRRQGYSSTGSIVAESCIIPRKRGEFSAASGRIVRASEMWMDWVASQYSPEYCAGRMRDLSTLRSMANSRLAT